MKSNYKYISIILTVTIVILGSCNSIKKDLGKGINSSENWTVNTDLLSGTEITDRFPVITDPIFKQVSETDFLQDFHIVYLAKFDDQVFIFPQILLHVESINFETENYSLNLNFCPLTKSACIWDRNVGSFELTFAASGITYNNNLVLYDIETESMWSQMSLTSIKGTHVNKIPKIHNLIETNWGIASAYFPNANVYHSYEGATKFNETKKANKSIEYEPGDRVLGIVDKGGKGTVIKYFNISKQENDLEEHIVFSNYKENAILISDKNYNYTVAFDNDYIFTSTGNFPNILSDSDGNIWDIFGYAISGPKTGERLKPTNAYIASLWAWDLFFTDFRVIL